MNDKRRSTDSPSPQRGRRSSLVPPLLGCANAEEIGDSSDGIPSWANRRNNSGGRASSDTRAYAITEAGSKALLSVFERIVEHVAPTGSSANPIGSDIMMSGRIR